MNLTLALPRYPYPGNCVPPTQVVADMAAASEQFDPSMVADAEDAALLAALSKRDAEVQLLLKSDPVKALQFALTDPPYSAKTVAVKDASFDVVCKPLMSIKEADIEVRFDTWCLGPRLSRDVNSSSATHWQLCVCIELYRPPILKQCSKTAQGGCEGDELMPPPTEMCLLAQHSAWPIGFFTCEQ